MAYGACGGKRVEWFWTYDLDLTPQALWPVLADSSRMNRALGVAEMKFEDRDGVRYGSSKPGGVPHAWVEVPWNWVVGQWLESVRLYERGFSKVVFAAFHLEPLGPAKTRVYVYFGAIPRGLVGRVALKLGFPSLEKGFAKVFAEVVEKQPKRAPLAVEAEARLMTVRDALYAKNQHRASVDALIDWVRVGDEQDLHRIQVRERARAWNLDEDRLLGVCLHATRLGLLELSWDAVCPHCRGVAEASANLGGLQANAACETCQIDFGTGASEAVEITFHVHPSIRHIEKRTYCSAEPATKEHIRVQRAGQRAARRTAGRRGGDGAIRQRLSGREAVHRRGVTVDGFGAVAGAAVELSGVP